MPTNDLEPKPSQPGGLQSMLARLRGMVQGLKSPEPELAQEPDFLPTWDVGAARTSDSPSSGSTVTADLAEGVPRAEPVELPLDQMDEQPVAESAPVEQTAAKEPVNAFVEREQGPVTAALGEPAAATQVAAQPCPSCQAPRKANAKHCEDCGWVFPPSDSSLPEPGQAGSSAIWRLKERYEVGRPYDDRVTVARYLGRDLQDSGAAAPTPMVVVREIVSEAALVQDRQAALDTRPIAEVMAALAATEGSELMPAAEPIALGPKWPSAAWERTLLARLSHTFFPHVTDSFSDGNANYLIEERPTGRAFWDAWDDPNASDRDRFGWLKQIAEALDRLHQHGVILEELRPEVIVITEDGQARISELSGLLPLPLPDRPLIRASCYTAPELVLTPDKVDARADLYTFGAMLYALHLGRELTDLDFEMQGVPKSILHRLPEIHPDFGRLIAKTFCRDPDARFPTDEAAKDDPTGFRELIDVLDQCGRSLGGIRLEIGAWTTTGMVRTGNEDAFAVFHSAESFEGNLGDRALVLLADGMGGYEAGEVAACLALRAIQAHLAKRAPFSDLLARHAGASDEEDTASAAPGDLESLKEGLAAALREANERVYTASRMGVGRPGMGCTAEIAYFDGRNLLVGHVGDSRIYHLRGGQLNQVTRDHTWVNRMVDMGALTPEEAANHERHAELCQAVGGHSEVEPSVYHRSLQPGDCVLVCSDGLSNHMVPEAITEILMAAGSAESAARRLINFANLQCAADNVTAVVIRAR
jgi:PPM family protein phosphatase